MISKDTLKLALQFLYERKSLLEKHDKLTESDFPMLMRAIQEMEAELKRL